MFTCLLLVYLKRPVCFTTRLPLSTNLGPRPSSALVNQDGELLSGQVPVPQNVAVGILVRSCPIADQLCSQNRRASLFRESPMVFELNARLEGLANWITTGPPQHNPSELTVSSTPRHCIFFLSFPLGQPFLLRLERLGGKPQSSANFKKDALNRSAGVVSFHLFTQDPCCCCFSATMMRILDRTKIPMLFSAQDALPVSSCSLWRSPRAFCSVVLFSSLLAPRLTLAHHFSPGIPVAPVSFPQAPD